MCRIISNHVALTNILVLMAFIGASSSYMGLSIPAMFLAIYGLQKVYLRTSRQVRLLDLEAKAPLYTHFVETLEGLATIRAFGWQTRMSMRFEQHLNISQKPYYLLYCIQRWLNLALGLIIGMMAVVTIALAISLRKTTNPGALGVALTSILSLDAQFNYLMLTWTELETSLGAISRIRNYEQDTPSEADSSKNLEPAKSWPAIGKVEFKNVSASYSASAPSVISIPSLVIEPAGKVRIIGRTGSGKSTLLSLITGLLAPTTGEILVDGVSVSKIKPAVLRERLITIPQDSFVLPGLTVRENVDLLATSSDDEIRSALQKVGLWATISSRGGLNAEMPGLSQGEGQVFALARVLLKKWSKKNNEVGVLLLDEATSSTDRETDERMGNVLKAEFKDWTILMIAHRLESVKREDEMVIRLDQGQIAAIGSFEEITGQSNKVSSD